MGYMYSILGRCRCQQAILPIGLFLMRFDRPYCGIAKNPTVVLFHYTLKNCFLLYAFPTLILRGKCR